MRFRKRGPVLLALLLVGVPALAGCGSGGSSRSDEIIVATHDNWAMSKKVMAEFTAKTGITVRIATNGDAGELTNKLVLTNGDPIADGFFGIDNTFATRAVDAGIVSPYAVPGLAPSVARFALSGDGGSDLTPIDYGDVCVNIDDTWFAHHHLTPPATFEDLAAPAYKGLTVTEGAKTSSTGLAFLLATIGRFGTDGWQGYWKKLVSNGLKIEKDWSNAYEVDFTAGGGNGDRPIVVSYSSSPPFTVPKGASRPTTSALLGTCFRQVEFAGVLKGAKNPEGMQKFIDFMSARSFQAALPENMYVYPVDTAVALPPEWKRFAPIAPKPYVVTPDDITAHRDSWLASWSEITHT
ncbi:MAG: thiamine ABC transporter substrate binding subunit [Marmoricola sp.]